MGRWCSNSPLLKLYLCIDAARWSPFTLQTGAPNNPLNPPCYFTISHRGRRRVLQHLLVDMPHVPPAGHRTRRPRPDRDRVERPILHVQLDLEPIAGLHVLCVRPHVRRWEMKTLVAKGDIGAYRENL